MQKETISRIIKRIEGKKCIVILGPQLLYENGSNLSAELAKYLKEKFREQVKYYQDDEMLKMSSKVRVDESQSINFSSTEYFVGRHFIVIGKSILTGSSDKTACL